MKKFRWSSIVIAMAAILLFSTQALAITEPDSTPTIDKKYVWRNVLETGDFFVILLENTPYTTTPSGVTYSDSFIWRFYDTDGTTELAQALGYAYNEDGYGYNIVSFYFDADDAPTWGQEYKLKLSGSPAYFSDPPEYGYTIGASDYSSLTTTSAVKSDIGDTILLLAEDFNIKWGLTTTKLTTEIEIGTALSVYGEAFFRGAIYGLQGMAPDAFQFVINSITTGTRSFDTSYVTSLENQLAGTYLEAALAAGEDFLDVDYNLMGIILVSAIVLGIIIANWYVAGGNIWRGAVEGTPSLIIFSRMGVFGLGELGLIAAMAWLYISAKIWKIV
jgi:hypothetical protein